MICSFRAILVTPEVDSDGTNRSQFPLANQRGNGLNGRKETIILADHEHAVSVCSHFDHQLRLSERWRKTPFKLHTFPRIKGPPINLALCLQNSPGSHP